MDNKEQEYQEMIKEWVVDAPTFSATHVSGVKMTLIEKNDNQDCSVVADFPKNWEISRRLNGETVEEINKDLGRLKSQFQQIVQHFPPEKKLSSEEMIMAMRQKRALSH